MSRFVNYTFSLFILFCMIIPLSYKSQIFYPTDSSYISVLSHGNKSNLQNFSLTKIDTTITNFQNYFPFNTNGSYGLASSPLLFNYQPKALGFVFYEAPYKNDVIAKNDISYYNTKGPYASLTGIAGSKQEQQFKLLFSNTFKNKLNLSLAFNRYGSTGFYKRQQSFTNNFYVSSNYVNKSGRVGYYGYFSFNKVKHLENGGLKNDSDFTSDVFVNKQLLALNLSAAKREVRYTSANFNPWFRLNKKEDSTTMLSHFLNYEFEYNGNYSKYIDNGLIADKYYKVYYFDTIKTLDSSHWRNFNNSLNYVLKINPLHTKIQLGFKNEYNQVHQYFDTTLYNNSVNAGIYYNHKAYSTFLKANYIINGSNSNDYLVELNNMYLHKIKLKDKVVSFKGYINLSAEKRHPDYFYNVFTGNNYIWYNNFVPTEKIQSTIGITSLNNRFGLGVVLQNIKNQLYLGENALPMQANSSIQNVSAFIHKDFLFFNHLGFNAKYTYQSSSYQAITSMPNHIINGSLFYQGNIKKAMLFQVGFNATYFSEFYGMAYSPVLNMYYVQTQKAVGNYPYVDFFISARIKPVRFFVKIDHVTQGFLGTNYSLTPNYIQNDRAFKFGLNWLFFD